MLNAREIVKSETRYAHSKYLQKSPRNGFLLPTDASNDILERAIPGCVVGAKCVCYIQPRLSRRQRETFI